ncbi:MAG: T9SS type A sorting domain-containing protein [Parafilimonas sp.]
MKKKLLLTPTVLFYCLTFLTAQTLDKSFVTTNNAVRATLQNGDTVFIGGDFTQVGMQSRGIAKFTPGNTVPDTNFPQLSANNTVNATEPDGNNGFYVAGSFTNFNGTPISNNTKILHVLSNGSLDASFGAVITDNDIFCLKKIGTTLYVGGAFTNIQNTSRPYLAALNAANASLNSWTPATPDNTVEKIDASTSKIFIQGNSITNIGGYNTFTHFGALRLSDGVYVNDFPTVNKTISGFAVSSSTLYLGGDFDQTGVSAYGFAKLNASDATVDADFPSTNGTVLSILPDDNGGYYVGGSFTKVANKSRSNLAHILSDGTVDVSFNASVNDQVLCLAKDNNNVYIGGCFTKVAGTTRNYIAALSKTDGSLTTWNPNPDSCVLTLVQSNNIIYMGGWFKNVLSVSRNYAAAVNANNTLNSWAPEPDYYVNQIIPNSDGSAFYICGGFINVKASAHAYIVRVNNTNGNPDAWHPQPDNVVKSIALSGTVLYITGSFSFVNGTPHPYLAAVNTGNNNATSFQADLNNYANSLNIASGKLYVAGNYSQIQGQNISYLSRIDLTTGNVDLWQPVSNAYTAVVYSDGTNVIAGGNFTLMNGMHKNYIASVNLTTNKFTTWSADGVASFNVNSIQKILPVDSDIFVGGNFSYYDGFHTVNNLLTINNITGNISHLLSQYPLGTVSQLVVYDNKLMVGGSFSNFYDLNTSANVGRNNIAAYDQTNYLLSSSVYEANNSLNGMFTDMAGNLIISGNFSLLNFVNRNYLAAISLNTKKALSWNPSPDNTVNALAINGTTLFVGGQFKNIGGNARKFLASVNAKNGNINSWNADCDSTVNAMAIRSNVLYVGGLFANVKGTARMHGAAIATTGTGALKPWNPATDDAINAINTTGNVYIGGDFTKVKTATRNYLARVNSNGKTIGWNPKPSKAIEAFAANSSTIFIGGNKFTKISGQLRNALAAYIISNNSITSFDAQLKYKNAAPQVNALALNGNTLYIGTTALDEINGAARGRLAAADITNSNAIGFNPLPDSTVLTLSAGSNYLLAGGLWNSLGSNVSPAYFAVFSLQAQIVKPQITVVNNNQQDHITASNYQMLVYPNPAKNIVTINFQKEITDAKISLVDIAGKTVWIKNNFIGSQLNISVKDLAGGTYFIVVESKGKSEKLKLIIQ